MIEGSTRTRYMLGFLVDSYVDEKIFFPPPGMGRLPGRPRSCIAVQLCLALSLPGRRALFRRPKLYL